jgi:glyoxylase-like metal-dependent hydrolase (beta-lactamase superfamily II)
MTTIEHAVLAGTFSLDGGTWEVENNVWVVGDERECVVIDAPHEAGAIAALIGDRRLLAVLCTHAHDDHVTVAPQLAERYGSTVWLHPDDDVLWQQTQAGQTYQPIRDGQTWNVAGSELTAIHTPGHAPGAVCFYLASLGVLFTGDTLFQGGPGATGRSYSDHDTILNSIRSRLLVLPPDTIVHTGHGPSTTLAAEEYQLRTSGLV